MAKYRRLSRVVAFQSLVASLFWAEKSSDLSQKCFSYVREEFAPELRNKDEFSRSLFEGTMSHREEIDAKIEQFAPEWPIEKLSLVERTLLEVGIFELMYHQDTPLAVIINEWVDIAKEFGDETAGRFVNGVLSNIGNSLRSQNKPK